jgi:hypothetical protein
MPKQEAVTHVHRCTFCGWQRGQGSPTMLDPQCERCGCVLEATDPAAGGAVAAPSVAAERDAASVAARRLAAVVLLGAMVPVLLAAAKVGYGHGGLPVASAAMAVAGLLLYVFAAPAPR